LRTQSSIQRPSARLSRATTPAAISAAVARATAAGFPHDAGLFRHTRAGRLALLFLERRAIPPRRVQHPLPIDRNVVQ
jgi:hypothetical protein